MKVLWQMCVYSLSCLHDCKQCIYVFMYTLSMHCCVPCIKHKYLCILMDYCIYCIIYRHIPVSMHPSVYLLNVSCICNHVNVYFYCMHKTSVYECVHVCMRGYMPSDAIMHLCKFTYMLSPWLFECGHVFISGYACAGGQ